MPLTLCRGSIQLPSAVALSSSEAAFHRRCLGRRGREKVEGGGETPAVSLDSASRRVSPLDTHPRENRPFNAERHLLQPPCVFHFFCSLFCSSVWERRRTAREELGQVSCSPVSFFCLHFYFIFLRLSGQASSGWWESEAFFSSSHSAHNLQELQNRMVRCKLPLCSAGFANISPFQRIYQTHVVVFLCVCVFWLAAVKCLPSIEHCYFGPNRTWQVNNLVSVLRGERDSALSSFRDRTHVGFQFVPCGLCTTKNQEWRFYLCCHDKPTMWCDHFALFQSRGISFCVRPQDPIDFSQRSDLQNNEIDSQGWGMLFSADLQFKGSIRSVAIKKTCFCSVQMHILFLGYVAKIVFSSWRLIASSFIICPGMVSFAKSEEAAVFWGSILKGQNSQEGSGMLTCSVSRSFWGDCISSWLLLTQVYRSLRTRKEVVLPSTHHNMLARSVKSDLQPIVRYHQPFSFGWMNFTTVWRFFFSLCFFYFFILTFKNFPN